MFVVENAAPVRNVVPTVYMHACFVDEENCVNAIDLTGHALSKLPNLFGIGVAVEFSVFRIFHHMPAFHEFSGFVV